MALKRLPEMKCRGLYMNTPSTL